MSLLDIEPNKDQPRKVFSEESLAELADSIRDHGVLQPLLVRPMPNGRYQLIAGERRWRACRMVGLSEVPVVIREMTDSEAMELALIENLQREDLNPVEEAFGYRQLMEHYEMTQEKVAASVGKSRPAVANALRLLNLPKAVLDYVQQGAISPGHAKALLSLEDEALILENAAKVRADRITVREIEALAKKRKKERSGGDGIKLQEPEHDILKELEISLGETIARRVQIRSSGKEGGSLVINFLNKEDLESLVTLLTGQSCKID